MLWDALGITLPGMIACVGAGGKTSLLQSLAVCACRRKLPVLVTTTTRMFSSQLAGYRLILTEDYQAGRDEVAAALAAGETAAWLAGREGEKVVGLPDRWLDKLAADLPSVYMLVEADGARRSLIKAPAAHEPVIPARTALTVGVLNLRVLGQPLSVNNAHRPALVAGIIHKQAGETVSWQDLARLAVHGQGIFQHARGAKVLLLSGGGSSDCQVAAAQIAAYCRLAGAAIERVVVSIGYGHAMQPVTVYTL